MTQADTQSPNKREPERYDVVRYSNDDGAMPPSWSPAVLVEEAEPGVAKVQSTDGFSRSSSTKTVPMDAIEPTSHKRPILKATASYELTFNREHLIDALLFDEGDDDRLDLADREVKQGLKMLFREVPCLFDDEEWGYQAVQSDDELDFSIRRRDDETRDETILRFEVRGVDHPPEGE